VFKEKKEFFLVHRLVIILLSLTILLSGVSNALGDRLWTPGNFEIYVFDVGQGDSQLIVSPSGKTLLIDLAELGWESGKGAAKVAEKIRSIMGTDFKQLDYIAASHLHLDHIGYVKYGGIWALLERHGFTVGKLIDRDAGHWDDKDQNGVCDPDTEIVWHNAGTESGTARHWICYVSDPENAPKLHREIAEIGSTAQIDLGQDVVVKVVQRDAVGVKMADGMREVGGNHTEEAKPPSENDYSITLKITYGKLDYVTGGDTDGEYADSGNSYKYNDVESVIAPGIGQIEVLRVNHHGSEHSSNQKYMNILNPDVSVVSCGKNSYGHPSQATLERLLSTSKVYFTERCDDDRNYGSSIIVNGDVVIKSKNGTEYTVNGMPYMAGDPGVTTTSPEYDVSYVKINEVMPAPRSTFTTEWVELYNPTSKEIDLSGASIDDIANGGGKPYTIPQDTTIRAGGYWVWHTDNYFNNAGDDVRLLAPDGKEVDSFTYGSSSHDKSWARIPDGESWSDTMRPAPTMGSSNN
jgi:beta-lactamase superfamily II metal-dependent hydrolase